MFSGETGLDRGASAYAWLRHATLPTPPTFGHQRLTSEAARSVCRTSVFSGMRYHIRFLHITNWN